MRVKKFFQSHILDWRISKQRTHIDFIFLLDTTR